MSDVADVNWECNADGSIRRNSPLNARLALDAIRWDSIRRPDKDARDAVIDQVERRCGYRPTPRVIQRVMDDLVLML